MFKQVISNLVQSGWVIHTLENNWVCATHESLRRGLFLGNFHELPHYFQPWLRRFPDFSQFDVLVLCSEGFDSSQIMQHSFPDVQLWYWDTQYGNLFPFPPSNDSLIPQWIRQFTSGNPVFFEQVIRAEKQRRFTPFITYLLLVINLIIYGLMTLAGGSTEQRVLIAFGAKVNSLILEGEVWRLITSMFIHIGVMHLFFNLYALKVLGSLAEEIFGHRKFFFIYLLAGLGGSISSFIFSSALSAGASGAIFGLLGALVYYSYKRPSLWKSGLGMNLVVVILVNIGFGLIVPGIDNYAHLGGLLTGTLMTILIPKQVK